MSVCGNGSYAQLLPEGVLCEDFEDLAALTNSCKRTSLPCLAVFICADKIFADRQIYIQILSPIFSIVLSILCLWFSAFHNETYVKQSFLFCYIWLLIVMLYICFSVWKALIGFKSCNSSFLTLLAFPHSNIVHAKITYKYQEHSSTVTINLGMICEMAKCFVSLSNSASKLLTMSQGIVLFKFVYSSKLYTKYDVWLLRFSCVSDYFVSTKCDFIKDCRIIMDDFKISSKVRSLLIVFSW